MDFRLLVQFILFVQLRKESQGVQIRSWGETGIEKKTEKYQNVLTTPEIYPSWYSPLRSNNARERRAATPITSSPNTQRQWSTISMSIPRNSVYREVHSILKSKQRQQDISPRLSFKRGTSQLYVPSQKTKRQTGLMRLGFLSFLNLNPWIWKNRQRIMQMAGLAPTGQTRQGQAQGWGWSQAQSLGQQPSLSQFGTIPDLIGQDFQTQSFKELWATKGKLFSHMLSLANVVGSKAFDSLAFFSNIGLRLLANSGSTANQGWTGTTHINLQTTVAPDHQTGGWVNHEYMKRVNFNPHNDVRPYVKYELGKQPQLTSGNGGAGNSHQAGWSGVYESGQEGYHHDDGVGHHYSGHHDHSVRDTSGWNPAPGYHHADSWTDSYSKPQIQSNNGWTDSYSKSQIQSNNGWTDSYSKPQIQSNNGWTDSYSKPQIQSNNGWTNQIQGPKPTDYPNQQASFPDSWDNPYKIPASGDLKAWKDFIFDVRTPQNQNTAGGWTSGNNVNPPLGQSVPIAQIPTPTTTGHTHTNHGWGWTEKGKLWHNIGYNLGSGITTVTKSLGGLLVPRPTQPTQSILGNGISALGNIGWGAVQAVLSPSTTNSPVILPPYQHPSPSPFQNSYGVPHPPQNYYGAPPLPHPPQNLYGIPPPPINSNYGVPPQLPNNYKTPQNWAQLNSFGEPISSSQNSQPPSPIPFGAITPNDLPYISQKDTPPPPHLSEMPKPPFDNLPPPISPFQDQYQHQNTERINTNTGNLTIKSQGFGYNYGNGNEYITKNHLGPGEIRAYFKNLTSTKDMVILDDGITTTGGEHNQNYLPNSNHPNSMRQHQQHQFSTLGHNTNNIVPELDVVLKVPEFRPMAMKRITNRKRRKL